MRAAARMMVCALAFGVAHVQVGGDRPAARAAQDESPGPDRGTIAVLRSDGLMTPFAAFRGTRWQVSWPVNIGSLELPVNLASIPERWWGGETPETWQAWPIGEPSRPLKPIAPQIFPVHCAQRIGVRTDYETRHTAPQMQVEPYPKDGLAATAGVTVEPIETVSETDPGWGPLAVELLEEFDRAEDREIAMLAQVFVHPLSRDRRRTFPVRMEAWYRTRLGDGTTISYIEASRSYPPGPEDEGCGLETLFSGWVTHEAGESRPESEIQARVTYCDRVGATFMKPFGRIRLRDRVFWVAQIAGPESEWYTVAQLEPGRVRYVAEYFAGARDSCRDGRLTARSLSPSPSLRVLSR